MEKQMLTQQKRLADIRQRVNQIARLRHSVSQRQAVIDQQVREFCTILDSFPTPAQPKKEK